MPFPFNRQTVSPKLCCIGMETVLPDQPVITRMTRCSTFSSLAQITMRNSPNSRSTCSATWVPHCSIPAVLSALTAIKATGKWIHSGNNQRGLQRQIPVSVSFSFKPQCLCIFWQTSVFPFKYFARFRDKVNGWGNKFWTTCLGFDLPFHYALGPPIYTSI